MHLYISVRWPTRVYLLLSDHKHTRSFGLLSTMLLIYVVVAMFPSQSDSLKHTQKKKKNKQRGQ